MRMYFDIGANKGDYTQHLLNTGADKVIAVEANSFEAQQLAFRFRDQKVTIINKAVSNVPGMLKFYICPECDVISTADEDWRTKSRFAADPNRKWVETLVETISIDDMVKQFGIPTHIKVDVEGYEYKALLSMTKNYTQVRFEWAEEKAEEILLSIKYLMDIGYCLFGVMAGDTYHMQPDEFMSGEDMLQFMAGKMDANRKDLWGMIFALNEGDNYVN